MHRRRTTGIWIAGVAAATLALASCEGGVVDDGADGGGGGAGEFTLVLTSPTMSDQHPDLHPWMEQITERTDGRVQFETHFDGSLCSLADTSACISDGRADLGFHSSSYNPAEFPITEIGSMPFQTSDIQAQGLAMQQLWNESEEWQAEFDSANQHLLFFSPVGPHQLTMAQEVDSLEDLNGLSVRSTGGQSINLDVLGADPAAIAPVEVYEAIERGVLDGASYPIELAAQSQVAEVAPYVYDFGEHTGSMVMMMWSMNLETWESLPGDVQDVITEVSEEILDGIVPDYAVPAIEGACEAIADAGGEFHPIGTEEEGQALEDEALPQHMDQWTGAVEGGLEDPQAFLDRYHELLEENASGDQRTPGEICREHLG
ncbi:TRAP transporter substrate-binding protein DctP [Georgenia deserti]|uniref:TRAP transporter substrate-binding protein DctP n=1 Tax=Georgenia deserti TaxID=2093781 RepID=A0ABW4L1N3_9MICO